MSIAAQNPPQAGTNFAGTLTDILDRVEYRRVPAGQQIDPVYRLRYEAYRREDFIPFNSLGMLRDEFDDLPNAYCYGIYIDGELVSSLRLHHMTREHKMSPSYSVFTDVLDPLLEAGHTFIDPGRFTADLEASLAYPALPFLTLRIAVMATWYFHVKYCLSTVRPEHVAFYRRVFNSSKLGDARYYHGLSFPMEMWACDCPIVYPKLMLRYPFFNSTEREREQLFGPPHVSPLWIHTTARDALQPV
ncbi:MAG: acyl-homoserine-lactone synthase [Devosia sp.]